MNTVKNTIAIAALTLCLLCAIAIAAGCGKAKPVDPASVVKSSFIDARDGKKYRTVKIGELVWMAENLNFVTDSSWCYDNDDANCEKYGRLYSWDAAMGACPAGWRLPDSADWNALARLAGGRRKEFGDFFSTNYYWKVAGGKLKSKAGWSDTCFKWDYAVKAYVPYYCHSNSTDDYGFSSLPGGAYHPRGAFYGIGNHGCWWSATEHEDKHCTYYHYRTMNHNTDNVGEIMSSSKDGGQSVRCVQKGEKWRD